MNDDPFDPDERAERLVDWVDRAHAACEKGGQDAVAPLIDELDDLDKSMALHGLIVSRVDDKRHVTDYLDKRDSEARDLQDRLDRANHFLSTVGRASRKRDSEVRDLRDRLDRANELLSMAGMNPQ